MKIKVCESKYIKHYKDGRGHYISVYTGKDGELYAEGDVPSSGYTVKWDDDMAEYCEIDLGFEEITNLNPANIDLSEYEYCSHASGRDAHWHLYRKIVDGKGKWVARHQNTGEIREINYDQARGFEPIDDSFVNRLSRSLGSTLLPKRESTNAPLLSELEESPSYGGAFDISDTAYFTRDDLDEFSDYVVEKLSDASHADIIANVTECYLDEDTNILELTLSYGEYEHTCETKIDMRKIKIPKDLIKAYSNTFINYFLTKFTADMEHESSITESTRKNREPVKCLTNEFGDYINVYRDVDTGRLRAEGDIVHGKFIVGGSFNGPWDAGKEKYYKELGFKEVQEEASKINRLTFSDIAEYPYGFTTSWKAAPNPTFYDDFIELAEEHNCIHMYGPRGAGIDSRPVKFFICKSKSDYDMLKTALDDSKYIKNFIAMNTILSNRWDEIASVTDSIYVDRYSGGYKVKIPKTKKKATESAAVSDWKYVEKSSSEDDIFGDMTEGGYYIRQYGNQMTGYIYLPSETEKLYRAKLSREGHFDSLGYNVFIELDSAKNFIDETAAKLAPVTYDDVMDQLTSVNKHPKLKMYIDQSQTGNVTVSIEGVLLGGDPISFYDSSFIRTQKDIDFIKSQYEKAAKQIDHMYKIGYKGAK